MKKVILHIPPYWAGVFGSIFAAALAYIYILNGVEAPYPKIDSQTLLFIIIMLLPYSTISHELYEDVWLIKLMGIPVRKIPWDKFSGVIFFAHNNLSKTMAKPCAVLTLHPYQPGQHIVAWLLRYGYRRPFQTIYIRIPQGQEYKYLLTIRSKINNCMEDKTFKKL